MLRDDHGLNEEEISKYSTIITKEWFSFAEYIPNKEKQMTSFTHQHLSYEFLIPFSTVPLLRYQDALYLGEVGYVYPVNPNVLHGLEFELTSSVVSIVVSLDKMEKEKARLGFTNKYFYTKYFVSKELLQLISDFKLNSTDENANKIIEVLIKDGLSTIEDNRRPKKNYFKNMRDSIIYMMNNYCNPDLTIEEVASHSPYSYTYFTKAFKKYMHDTPVDHLNKLRISKAKELMNNKSLNLDVISTMCGYKNQSGLTEAFKRITNYTPTEYKKKFII
ncbi:MAG: AraC family transcriptional regulator [Acholeplasmatales bacterium]|nr:AraC family transcriptional regulator [Acholeplasmatales bacterium]